MSDNTRSEAVVRLKSGEFQETDIFLITPIDALEVISHLHNEAAKRSSRKASLIDDLRKANALGSAKPAARSSQA
ncbi:MAG: hypothetical protein WCJ64_11410 [Rhodospirillaceae bacterium]